MPIAPKESRNKIVAKKMHIPASVREAIEHAWADARKEKIASHTTAFRLSLSATYFFGMIGVAGYFNVVNESVSSYSQLFLNASLLSGAFAGYHYTERKEVIQKKRMGEQEIEEAFITMQMAKQFQMNQV
ncbi:hypothetical protein BH09DEP1_BH09DEP1_1360 [soil metagenome]